MTICSLTVCLIFGAEQHMSKKSQLHTVIVVGVLFDVVWSVSLWTGYSDTTAGRTDFLCCMEGG